MKEEQSEVIVDGENEEHVGWDALTLKERRVNELSWANMIHS